MSAVLKELTVSVSTETYVSVDVDVPLSEIDTEDLLEELDTRNVRPETLIGIYEAMAAGRRDEAYELMRLYIMDTTGRLLP